MPVHKDDGGWSVVYRPPTKEEAQRRAKRAEEFNEPFLHLPSNPPQHKVLLILSDGTKIRTRDVEMVYNDCRMADYVSNQGEDGPLYETVITPQMKEVLDYARKMFIH